MKVSTIEAKYSEGYWVYTKKQTYLPEIKDCFIERSNGYRYYFNPDEEDEAVAMEIFKAFLIIQQKEKIKELYTSIKRLS